MIINEIVRSSVARFLNWKSYILFAFYGVLCIVSKVSALRTGLNFFEYITEVLCNQQNIVYFVIPVYLLSVFNLVSEASSFVIIRTVRYRNYFISKACSYFIISALTVLGMLLILFITGVGLPFRNEYNIRLEYAANFIGPALRSVFTTPLALVLAQSVHLICGLTFLSIVLEAIYIFTKNRGIVLLLLAASYVFTVFSASGKLDINRWAFLMNTYTTLHIEPHSQMKTLLVEIAVCIFLSFTVSKYWYIRADALSYRVNRCSNNWNIKQLLNRKNIAISIVLLIIANVAQSLTANVSCLSDYIYVQLIGYGFGYFNITSFSVCIIVMCTPLFFQSYFLQEQLQNNSCFVKVRYDSRLSYLRQILLTLLVFTTIYIIMFGAIIFIGVFFLGLKDGTLLSGGGILGTGFVFYTTILKALLLKWLEVMMILLLSLAILIYTKKTGLSCSIPTAGYFVNIFNMKWNQFNPFGISSLMRWKITSDYSISFLEALIILCTINMILATFLVFKGQREII